MGDGLLAVFLIAPDSDNAREVCNVALEAAREARDAVARLSGRLKHHREDSRSPEDQGVRGVQFGVALHLGQVAYGNIGSRNRLKFTCVGQAMNLAARIEALTSPLHRTILADRKSVCRERV